MRIFLATQSTVDRIEKIKNEANTGVLVFVLLTPK